MSKVKVTMMQFFEIEVQEEDYPEGQRSPGQILDIEIKKAEDSGCENLIEVDNQYWEVSGKVIEGQSFIGCEGCENNHPIKIEEPSSSTVH